MMKLLPLTLLISLLISAAQGQDTTAHRMAVNLGIHRGFLIAHRPMIVPLQQDHITGLEANLVLRPDGSRQWQQAYGYPEIGLSLAVWDLGNRNQLGTGIALIPYIDFPISKGKKTSFDLKFGWGIGYVDKIFNADDNYKNVAIGSHLNCALILQPRFKADISKHLSLNGGLSITHFSNGSITMPNLGLNLMSVTGGISYKFGSQNIINRTAIPPFSRSSRTTIFVAGAIKEVYPAGGKNYFAGTISANQSWQISRKSAFGAGADIFYDNSVSQKMEEQNIESSGSLETIRAGLHGSYDLVISDLSIIINMGAYIYSKYPDEETVYQRIGLRYRVNKKLFVLMHLKSHWGKADFIEWGVGYRIDKFKSK